MSIKEIHWRRGDVELILDVDRKALVPLLRQTCAGSRARRDFDCASRLFLQTSAKTVHR